MNNKNNENILIVANHWEIYSMSSYICIMRSQHKSRWLSSARSAEICCQQVRGETGANNVGVPRSIDTHVRGPWRHIFHYGVIHFVSGFWNGDRR